MATSSVVTASMSEDRGYSLKAIIILGALLPGMTLADDTALAPEQNQEGALSVEEANRALAFTITVVRLKYANAEELAATLAPILPPGLTVVAYPPTNSLIISGGPVALRPPDR